MESVQNRFVLVNVGLQETFLKGAWLVHRAEVATRDYHEQIRSTDFETDCILSSTLMLLLLLLPHPLPLQGRQITILKCVRGYTTEKAKVLCCSSMGKEMIQLSESS
jgi:hypothetical protein